MQKKEKVLITGASGFLGYHLVQSALKMGLNVFAGIRTSSNTEQLEGLAVTYVYPDFENIRDLENELNKQQYDYIIHAAGATKSGKKEEYIKVNANYTYNLAHAAARLRSLKKFIYISSLAAVGPLENTYDELTEQTKPGPVTDYGRSKLMGEQKLAGLDMPWLILRPTAVYGPGEKNIFIILKMIRNGLEAYIGKFTQQLSFIHAEDVADAVVNALFSGRQKEIYHLADGKSYSRYELAVIAKSELKKKTIRLHIPVGIVRSLAGILEKIYEINNKSPVLNKDKIKELTAPNWSCNIQKAVDELGFNPAYTLPDGLAQTLQWYKRHRWL